MRKTHGARRKTQDAIRKTQDAQRKLMKNKNFIIVTVILIAAAIISGIAYRPPRQDIALKTKVANFPMQIGEWAGKDIPLSENDYRILETRNLILREYKGKKGESVYLYIIYSEDNRKVSHPPEVCFTGSGATIVNKEQILLTDKINATKLIIEKGNERQAVVYWYKAGSLNTDNYLQQQFRVVMDRALGKRTSGALIRISANIKDNHEAAALGELKKFSALIEPLLPIYIP